MVQHKKGVAGIDLHIVFSNHRKKIVDKMCMHHFNRGKEVRLVVDARPEDGHEYRQQMSLVSGTPLVARKTLTEIKNGKTLIFQDFSEPDSVELGTNDGDIVHVTKAQLASSFELGFSVTVLRSQGMTVEGTVMVHLEEHKMSFEGLNVALSRATKFENLFCNVDEQNNAYLVPVVVGAPFSSFRQEEEDEEVELCEEEEMDESELDLLVSEAMIDTARRDIQRKEFWLRDPIHPKHYLTTPIPFKLAGTLRGVI